MKRDKGKTKEQLIKELLEHEAQYIAIVENSFDAILLTETDGRIRAANPAACRMFGRTEQEICQVGRNGLVDVADPRLGLALEQRHRTGEVQGELTFVRRDGTKFVGEMTSKIFRGRDGKTQTSMIIRDVTERKVAEEKLCLSEEMFSKAFHVGPTGMTITRIADGKFIDANESFCRMFEFNRNQVIGHTSTELNMWTPEERKKLIQQQLESGGLNNFELVARSKSGKLINVLFSSKSMQLNGENCLLTNMADITERKRAEVQLRNSEDKFLTLFAKTSQPIGLLRLPEFTFVDINEAWIKLFGHTKEESIGKTSLELGILRDPERRSHVIDEHRQYNKVRDLEQQMFTKSGAAITVLINADIINIGGQDYALTSVHDITELKRTEKELTQLRQAVETSGEVIFLTDPAGIITFINPEFTKLYGYGIEDVVGKTTPRILKSGKMNQEDYEDFWKALIARQVVKEEMENKTKDGSVITIEETVNAIIDGNNCLTGFLAIQRDITDRKNAENEQSQSYERHRLVLKTAMDGIWRVNLQGRIIEVNSSYCQMSGYSEQELLTMSISDLEAIEAAAETATHMQNVMSKGQDRFESKHRRKDGSTFDVEVSVQYQASEEGSLIAFIHDITKHKLDQEKLEQSAKEWESTFDSITDLVSIHNTNRRLIRVNKAFAAAFGKTKEELTGKFCYELVHGTDRPPAYCPNERTLNQKKTTIVEEFEPHLNAWIQISTSPIFDEKGEVVGTIHATRDITKVKQIQEQLIMQDRLVSIGQLVSGVAHELNNPLTSVIGFSELVLQRELPDDVKADLKIVNDEAKRTSLIVKNLLSFARQQPQDKKLIDINEPLKTVLQIRSHEQSTNNIKVNTHLAPNLAQIVGNGSQLQQVFFNIVTNAEQAMLEAHKKGTLTITTEQADDIVRVRFTNDGPEISPENIKKLFTPFFTTKPVGQGTGLGLSICHGIITEHGGKIYAESELGKGATFIVELPAKKAA